ncbi:MAG: PH domain-containing protein, partial [Acidobacteria bacterium]|nr:PH domain-containing protein [Acidobacteriota bacterium]
MGYVTKNLMPGETVLLRPVYHPVRFLPGALGVVLGGLIAVGALVLPAGTASPGILLAVGGVLALVGLVALALRAIVDSFDEFAVTSLRIIKKTGVLTRRVSQIPFDKVQDLRLVATLWGRWLSYGDVAIDSASEEGPVVFRRIQNPEAFRNAVFTRRAAAAGSAASVVPVRTAEERLKDVERLFAAGTLTEAEYKVKRQELIR